MKIDELIKNQRLKPIVLTLFELVIFVFYLRLRISNAQLIREPRISFGDTTDYLLIASQSLVSSKFWMADKPFLIPLFFKMIGGNVNLIFTVQLYLSIFCWGFLAIVFGYSIRSYPLKFIGFSTILGFSLSQQIILWDSLLLSESFHFSLAALFYAATILLIKSWGKTNLTLVIVLSAMLVFTRDANAYMFLMAGAILLLLAIIPRHRPRFSVIGSSFIILFIISYCISSAGKHSYSALLNTIGMRILPNQEYLAYFEKQGMPISDALLQRAGKTSHSDNLTMLTDPNLAAFRNWVLQHGNITFIKFLWFYKADTLQLPLNEPETVMAPNLYYYSASGFKQIIEGTRIGEILYPMNFGVIIFWFAQIYAIFIVTVAFQQKKTIWLLPLLMILLAYPQIVFVWNADPNDIFRHSLHLNVQWRLGLWFLIFFHIDDLIKIIHPKIHALITNFTNIFHGNIWTKQEKH